LSICEIHLGEGGHVHLSFWFKLFCTTRGVEPALRP